MNETSGPSATGKNFGYSVLDSQGRVIAQFTTHDDAMHGFMNLVDLHCAPKEWLALRYNGGDHE